MMSESKLLLFNNEEFGEIRTLLIEGEPWFVGNDIAAVLGYSRPVDAIRKRVEDEDKGVCGGSHHNCRCSCLYRFQLQLPDH